MPPDEVEKILTEMEAWCSKKYGRQTELAEALGVSKQLVANWIARRRALTLKNYFAIRDFLNREKKKSGL